MKTPRTVFNKYRVINRLILWNILFAVVLTSMVLWATSCEQAFAESPFADAPPPVPPIDEYVRSDTNQVPANLSIVYKSGLQLAFPMFPSTGFQYAETFKEEGGLWYFRAPCSCYQKIVQRTPILYRWGDDEDWRPYTRKTSQR